MKLIDLLVQELPKLGGWPDGSEYARVSYFGVGKILVDFRFPDAYGELSYCIGVIARNLIDTGTDVDYHMIRRDSYESALSASQKPAWNCEGLPPAGCECEYRFPNVNYRSDFSRGKVIAYGNQKVFIEHWSSKNEFVQPIDNIEFRPLRTEEERKRDVAIEVIDRFMPECIPDTPNEFYHAKKIYDAIAAGKIPGVKLDD